jgi:hypothetical protein
MALANLRRYIAVHCVWWCVAGVLLSALQPFLFTHFRNDGWEDEPGFRVRNVEAMAMFWPDERDDHKKELETTLYAPAGAHLEVPDAFQHGLDTLLALVFLLLPLTVGSALVSKPEERRSSARVPFASGAPPPTALWRNLPPQAAPPSAT